MPEMVEVYRSDLEAMQFLMLVGFALTLFLLISLNWPDKK